MYRYKKIIALIIIIAAVSLQVRASQAEAIRLVTHPYIQDTYTGSVTIVWNTDIAGDSKVEYGATGKYGKESYSKEPVKQHIVTLTGLKPGSEYYYSVSGNGKRLTEPGLTFRTNKESGAFTFIVFGDSGNGSSGQKEVAGLIERISPDLVLHTGDVIYPSGEAKDYAGKYFLVYKDTIESVPFYPVAGNHDLVTDSGRPYLDAFVLPAKRSGSGTERYYSFDYADAHFIALDTFSSNYSPGSAQFRWLKKDLASITKRWKFVFLHKPVYSSVQASYYHGTNADIIQKLAPLFEKYGVDIVFSGHCHNYERSKRLKNKRASDDGVTYVVTGGGGARLTAKARLKFDNPWTANLTSALHVTKVTIDGSTLLLEAIKPDSTIFDTYTIKKPD